MEDLTLKQIKIATLLHQVLVKEREALKTRDAEAIKQLSDEKNRLTAALDQLAKQQNDVLASKGLELTKAGLNTYVSELPKPQSVSLNKALSTLTKALEQCKKQNIINGQMIAASRQSVETALSILRGQHGQKELTYGPGGETVSNTNGGSLAKA